MLTYKYTAKNTKTGETIKSELQAENEHSAAKLIQDQDLVPLEIVLGDGVGKGSKLRHIKAKDKVLFSRQLSTLINAGLPLVQSLRNVSRQTTNNSLKTVINEIINDVEGGSTLAYSFGKHPQVFNPVYLSMIAAGEVSGTLDVTLERLANQQEKDADIMAKIRGALIYPLIVLVVMLAVLGFMVVEVLPQVEMMYTSMPGAHLPLITKILLVISHLVIKFWWIFLIIAIAAIILTTRWTRSVGGKRFIDKFYLRAPILKVLFMKMYMARFTRTAGTLVASGVPILQVLEITGQAVNNMYIEQSLQNAITKVRAGKSLGDALSGDPNFLELVPNMIKIGEQSGSMEQMLGKAADYYEKELDNEIKNLQTTIEPVMMVLMGVMAFIIVAAVLLPIYSLANTSGLGG